MSALTRGAFVGSVVLILALSSCASSAAPGLTLDEGAAACMPVKPGERGVIAEQTSLEDPNAPVTLTGVELVDPKGMRLVEAFAVRYTEEGGIGSMSLDDPDDVWATRVPAVGAVIDGRDGWSIAFVLERTGNERGTADAVSYSFTDAAGHQQHVVGTLGLEIDDPC
jgi:hypothetical protein